ncbi:MAG: helix-turn-helix domain-containing protein [Propionibacteriaceae bacterium]
MATRDTILDAAAQVMRQRGLAATTTREIARAAGYSEATLYKNFTDKQDLFLAVLRERLPPLGRLDDLVGQDTVTENLTRIVTRLIRFYAESFPTAASLFSQPGLLADHRAAMASRGAGPRHPVQAVVGYLRAEQDEGRLGQETDVEAVGALLAGAAFQHAFFVSFEETTELTGVEDWAARLVQAAGPFL